MPAVITISVALAVYSSAPAVPSRVKGIVISNPEAFAIVAVRVTESEEFSTMVAADNAKVTTSGESSSVIVNITSEESTVELVGVPGVSIIVSSASSVVSSTELKVIVPVVDPVGILICGESW